MAASCSFTLPHLGFSQESSEPANKKWSATISGGLIQSTVHPDEADFYVGAYSSVSGSYQWSETLSILAGLSANKKLNGYRENQLSSTYVGIDQQLDDMLPFLSERGVQSSVSLTFDLPLNKDDVKYDGYRGSLQLSPEASYKVENGALEGLRLGLNSSMTRYFYTHTTDKGGNFLTQYAGSVGLNVSKPIRHGFVLSASFGLSRAWDYDGSPFKTRYSATQTLSKQLTPEWSMSVGHANRSGYVFDYNGVDPRLTFYDPFNSKVYISTSYTL